MAHVEARIMIEQPVEAVFAFMVNLENSPQWQSGLVEARQTSVGAIGVGTRGVAVRRIMGRDFTLEGEITAFEENTSFTLTSVSGLVQGVSVHEFREVGGGTSVSLSIEASMTGFFKLPDAMLGGVLKREAEGDLASLKRLLEG